MCGYIFCSTSLWVLPVPPYQALTTVCLSNLSDVWTLHHDPCTSIIVGETLGLFPRYHFGTSPSSTSYPPSCILNHSENSTLCSHCNSVPNKQPHGYLRSDADCPSRHSYREPGPVSESPLNENPTRRDRRPQAWRPTQTTPWTSICVYSRTRERQSKAAKTTTDPASKLSAIINLFRPQNRNIPNPSTNQPANLQRNHLPDLLFGARPCTSSTQTLFHSPLVGVQSHSSAISATPSSVPRLMCPASPYAPSNRQPCVSVNPRSSTGL